MNEELTEIKVRKLEGYEKLKAFVDITILGKYVVRGFKIMENERGLWVAMPSQKDKNDKWQDIFFPITKEAREELNGAIVAEYEKS